MSKTSREPSVYLKKTWKCRSELSARGSYSCMAPVSAQHLLKSFCINSQVCKLFLDTICLQCLFRNFYFEVPLNCLSLLLYKHTKIYMHTHDHLLLKIMLTINVCITFTEWFSLFQNVKVSGMLIMQNFNAGLVILCVCDIFILFADH